MREVMKLLLMAINARFSHTSLSVRTLREYLRPLLPEVTIREYTIKSDPRKIYADIIADNPEILGISVYIWNTQVVENLLFLFTPEENPPKIILGGPEAGYNPQYWLERFPFITHIVAGAGEKAMEDIVTGDISPEERIIRRPPLPMEALPFPYHDKEREPLQHRLIYYETSRGCPYRCSYCISSRHDQGLQFRPLGRVFDDLARIAAFKPRTVKFVDRTFNTKPAHYRAILSHIIEYYSHSGISFHLEIFPDVIKEEDIALLAKAPAGLFQVEIGIQSIHDITQERIHRTQRWARARKGIQEIIALGTIHVHLDMLIGLPGEDLAMVKDSFNEIISLGACHFQVGMLKVLPGTILEEESTDYQIHYNNEPPWTVRSTAALSPEETHNCTIMSHLVDRIHNSGGFTASRQWLEGIHATPFDFYYQLAGTLRKSARKVPSKWDDVATLLLASSPEERRILLRDLLRLDWCRRGGSHRYPVILQSEALQRYQRAWRHHCRASHLNGSHTQMPVFLPEDEDFPTLHPDVIKINHFTVFNRQGKAEFISMP